MDGVNPSSSSNLLPKQPELVSSETPSSEGTKSESAVSDLSIGKRIQSFWSLIKKRSRYYIPVLKWLPRYEFGRNLFHDVLSGITVAMLLIPQSLSYASGLARLDPVFGLYSSFAPALIYGLLGTSRQLSVGPEALVSLLIGATADQIAGTNASTQDRLEVAIALSLMVGLFTLCFGLLRLGFLDSVLSRALLRGFITAVACVILIEQLPPLLGVQHPGEHADNGQDSPFSKLIKVLQQLSESNWVTCLISSLSVVFLFGASRLKRWVVRVATKRQTAGTEYAPLYSLNVEGDNDPREGRVSVQLNGSQSDLTLPWYIRLIQFLPEILIVVSVTILFSYGLRLNSVANVQILGDAALQTGFIKPRLPHLSASRFKALVTPAILIAVLGFVESIVVAKSFASKYQYPVSANRELVAFGVVNLIGSTLNCFPAFASIARSHVNDSAGAKTQLAGMITGLIILFTILFFLPIFYYLPRCVMASIVLVAAAGLLEFEDVIFMLKIRAWKDIALMMLTFLTTIFISVEAGTLISIGLSLILVVKHSTYPKISILGRVIETSHIDDEDEHPTEPATTKVKKIKYKPLDEIFRNPEQHQMDREDQEVLVVKVEESLFFANTGQMKDRLRRAEVYGGWLHIHPSEEERRPAASTAVRPIQTVPIERRKRGYANSDTTSFTPQLSPGKEKQEQYPLERHLTGPNENEIENAARFSAESGKEEEYASEESAPHLRAVIFDIENMQKIDASAIQILKEIVEEYHHRGIDVCFVKLREANKSIFLRSGILGDICGSDRFFRKISDAMQFLKERWEWQQSLQASPTSDPLSPPPPTSSYSAYSVL